MTADQSCTVYWPNKFNIIQPFCCVWGLDPPLSFQISILPTLSPIKSNCSSVYRSSLARRIKMTLKWHCLFALCGLEIWLWKRVYSFLLLGKICGQSECALCPKISRATSFYSQKGDKKNPTNHLCSITHFILVHPYPRCIYSHWNEHMAELSFYYYKWHEFKLKASKTFLLLLLNPKVCECSTLK